MASNTERLGLLKKDPVTDGADTFNIKTMLNDNWNKIDEFVALIDPVTGKLLPGQENPVDVSDIQTKLDNIETSVGNLTGLETVEKSSLVAAINEIRRALATHLADETAHGIGDKAILKTTDKSSIVGAMNELFTNASNGKTAVANAVTAKGVAASPSDTFTVLATKIGQIYTGKKWASGKTNSIANSTLVFDGQTLPYVSVTGLDFKPSTIIAQINGNIAFFGGSTLLPLTAGKKYFYVGGGTNPYVAIEGNLQFASNGFTIPFSRNQGLAWSVDWVAIE